LEVSLHVTPKYAHRRQLQLAASAFSFLTGFVEFVQELEHNGNYLLPFTDATSPERC